MFPLAAPAGIAPAQERPPHEAISDREYRGMWLLASGKGLQQIAGEMRPLEKRYFYVYAHPLEYG